MFVFIKLEEPIGSSMGPNFEVVANVGTVVPNIFTAAQLTDGVLVEVDDSATLITVNSGEPCNRILNIKIVDLVNFFGTITSTTTSTTTIAPCSQAICGRTFEGYGYLYNWWAIFGAGAQTNGGRNLGGIVNTTQPFSDERNEWRVPSDTDCNQLITHLGGESVAGGKLKTTCTSPFTTNNGLWDSPNAGATNEVNWSGIPGGMRNDEGAFNIINVAGYWWSSTEIFDSNSDSWTIVIDYFVSNIDVANFEKRLGHSIRLVRPATTAEQDLADGTTSNQNPSLPHYIGNSRSYITVKIGNQVWTAQNLIDTTYNNGTPIPEVTNDVSGNATWAALTTGARCSYPVNPDGSQGQIELCGIPD